MDKPFQHPLFEWRHAWLLAAACFLFQMVLAYFFGANRYLALHCWDSAWFQTIIDRGYYFAFGPGDSSNVSLFPGYPLWAIAVKRALHLGTENAQLVAAQLACVGFWIYYVLLLRRWFDGTTTALLAGLLACQPGSFFLIAGYSESLFLFGLVGCAFWFFRGPGLGSSLLAALHLAVVTGTRCVGIPILVFPVIHYLLSELAARRGNREGESPSLASTAIVVGIGALGAVAYFWYCQERFGRWDAYWEAVRVWGTRSDWLVFFKPALYKFGFTPFSPDTTGRLMAVVTLVAGLVGTGWLAARQRWMRQQEIATLLVTGLFLLALTIVGRGGNACTGMVRYLIPVDALVFPTLGLWMRERPGSRWRTLALSNPLVVAGLFFALFQLCLIYRFAHAQWVA